MLCLILIISWETTPRGRAQTKQKVSIIIMHIIRVVLLYKMSLIINNVHYNIPQTLRCFQMSLNWINMGKPLDIKSTIIWQRKSHNLRRKESVWKNYFSTRYESIVQIAANSCSCQSTNGLVDFFWLPFTWRVIVHLFQVESDCHSQKMLILWYSLYLNTYN